MDFQPSKAILARFESEVQKAKEGDIDACRFVLETLTQLAIGNDDAAREAKKRLRDVQRQIRKGIEKSPELKSMLFKAALDEDDHSS